LRKLSLTVSIDLPISVVKGALEREQQPLAVEAAAVADEAPIRADDTVARQDDRDRFMTVPTARAARGRPAARASAP
jgi:hypothetical protein